MRRIPVGLITVSFLMQTNVLADEISASSSLSPKMKTAISELASEDFATRNHGFDEFQTALNDQMIAILSHDVPEVRARVLIGLEYNEALTRWGIAILRLPDDQRKSIVSFAAEPDAFPTMPNLFNPNMYTRLSAIRTLGKIKHPAVDLLLAQLIKSPDRPVYVTAMDVACDREPSDLVVDALWTRAVASGYLSKGTSAPQAQIIFRGNSVGALYANESMALPGLDHELACQALVKLSGPQLDERLVSFFKNLERLSGQNSGFRVNVFSDSYNPLRHAYELAILRKPKNLLPILYRLATGNPINPNKTLVGKEAVFYSSRTPAIAALCRILGNDPAKLKLKQYPVPNPVWMFPTEADELAAINQVHQWATSYPDWVASIPATQPVSAAPSSP